MMMITSYCIITLMHSHFTCTMHTAMFGRLACGSVGLNASNRRKKSPPSDDDNGDNGPKCSSSFSLLLIVSRNTEEHTKILMCFFFVFFFWFEFIVLVDGNERKIAVLMAYRTRVLVFFHIFRTAETKRSDFPLSFHSINFIVLRAEDLHQMTVLLTHSTHNLYIHIYFLTEYLYI